ncbi:MAG: hypothetical protein KIH44_004070 [Octadecabacter sp.]|nr:hypothetical protein [Octadecabacter sp.]
MTDAYHYRLQGRRPVMWILLAIGLLAFGFALTQGGPIMGYVIFGLYLAFVLATLVLNPITGLDIVDGVLSTSLKENAPRVQLNDIDHLLIDNRSDDCTFTLYLKNNTTLVLRSIDVPSIRETTRVFEGRGIAVKQA